MIKKAAVKNAARFKIFNNDPDNNPYLNDTRVVIRKIEDQLVIYIEDCPAIDIETNQPSVEDKESNPSKYWEDCFKFRVIFNAQASHPE